MKFGNINIMLVALFILNISQDVNAQPLELAIPLQAVQYRLDRLAPGSTTGSAAFTVDQSSFITLEIIATVGGLTTSIVGPKGEVLTPATIASFGGQFSTIEGSEEPDIMILFPLSPGFHYIYSFPSLGPGNYIVRFEAASNLAVEVAVITQVSTDSPVVSSLFATETQVVMGNPAVLTAAVFEGEMSVVGASVSVTIHSDTQPPVTIVLQDNGIDADTVAGDGLYTAEFIADSPGTYEAVAEIAGLTQGGIRFVRQSATRFDVVAQTASLTGSVTETGVDNNGNGLFERVAINVGVNVAQSGNYQVFVHLETAKGQTVVRSSRAILPVGPQTVIIDFEAAAFRQLAENGPYGIALIELHSMGANGAILSDRLLNVGQTRAYQLSQFERPAILLTGNISDAGIDTNKNGRFDILRVSVEVDLLVAESYQWSARLIASNEQELALSSNSASLNVGVNTIILDFNGRTIGATGLDGPYFVVDFLIFGDGGSFVANGLQTTKAYKFTDFELTTDFDGDGDIDLDDINILLADLNRAVKDSACGVQCDLDKDGKITALDARLLVLRCTRPGCATH
jgi:hypothetical protein